MWWACALSTTKKVLICHQTPFPPEKVGSAADYDIMLDQERVCSLPPISSSIRCLTSPLPNQKVPYETLVCGLWVFARGPTTYIPTTKVWYCALQVAWQLRKYSNVELTNESTEALRHLVSHWSILKSNVYTTVKRPAKHSRLKKRACNSNISLYTYKCDCNCCYI